jgi:hypothetical protein
LKDATKTGSNAGTVGREKCVGMTRKRANSATPEWFTGFSTPEASPDVAFRVPDTPEEC